MYTLIYELGMPNQRNLTTFFHKACILNPRPQIDKTVNPQTPNLNPETLTGTSVT
jgi:hypothetical protein